MSMKEESIFVAALAQPDRAQRAAYLDQACADNPALRQEIEGLLAAHAVENLLDRPPADLGRTGAYVPEPNCRTAAPGDRIGPYKLLERIGDGGMGEVWVADQQEPISRRVALKLIKPGMDSRGVLARFEAERQALALMDHPNIAKVLDAGTTPDGRPYFVMELVKGVSITEFCDARRLTPRERLELFVPVCQAIQHAHTKGIIHRDIKPGNVLVALHDETPVPKVIDFGVAKAIGRQLTEKTLYTGFGVLVGTPAYMAPEQATLNQLDIDTRADVYALGVLLYELLAGSPPLEPERLRKAGLDEVLRIVREEEPPRPSQRLSTSEARATIAATRQSDPAGLSALMRGELDWVVMRCLEKDRNRRYETANGLARDVQRYLSGDAVEACPPTLGYRLRKLYRKNRAAVRVTCAFLGLMTGAAVFSAVLADQAERARTDAEHQRDTAEAERVKAEAARQAAETARCQREEKLLQALMAEANASRLSRRVGQRFGTLATIREAMALARELKKPQSTFDELRNLAIAALALPDLRPDTSWVADRFDRDEDPNWAVDVDPTYTFAAVHDARGVVSVRRVGADPEGCQEVARLAPPEASRGGHVLVAWEPGGRHLAVWSWQSNWLRVWQVDWTRQTLALDVPSKCRAFGFAPGGRHVFAVVGRELKQCELGTTDFRRVCLVPAVTAPGFAHHPTRPEVAICCDRDVVLVDLSDGRERARLRTVSPPERLVWHPHGELLAVAAGSHAEIWDVPRKRRNHRLEHSGGALPSFNEAGDLLCTTNWLRRVKLWNPYTGREVLVTGGGHRRFGPGDRAVMGYPGQPRVGPTVPLTVVEAGREYRTLVAGAGVTTPRWYGGASVHPGGRLVAVGTTSGLSLADLGTGSERAFVPIGNQGGFLFAPDGSLLVKDTIGLFRWPVRDDPGSPGRVVVGPPEPVPVSFRHGLTGSANGAMLAGVVEGGATVWHRDRPRDAVKVGPHLGCVSVALSPDGKTLATGSGYDTKVWDVATGRLVRDLPASPRHRPVFSSDGRWLLSSAGHRWRVADWSEHPRPPGSAHGNVATTPDGRSVVWGSKGVIVLEDSATGRALARLTDPNLDGLNTLSFSTDSTLVVGTTVDGSCAHVWDLRKIRKGLVELGLDWDAPPYPPEPVAPPVTSPLQVEVVGVELLRDLKQK